MQGWPPGFAHPSDATTKAAALRAPCVVDEPAWCTVGLPGTATQKATRFTSLLQGGTVLSWVDVCAGLAAKTFARGPCVTASVDAVHFLRPCHVRRPLVSRG